MQGKARQAQATTAEQERTYLLRASGHLLAGRWELRTIPTYLGILGTYLIPDLGGRYTSPTVPYVLRLHLPDCHEIGPRDDDVSTS